MYASRISLAFLTFGLLINSVAAVTFPTTAPSGVTVGTGGTFGWYFQNIIKGNLGTGLCPGGQGIIGFNTTPGSFGLPICQNMSLAPGIQGQFLGYSGSNWVGIDINTIFFGGGNVGIGTMNPQQKLVVNGDALINGLTVGLGGGNIVSNTAVGYQALFSNTYAFTISNNNTAMGYQSLYSNTNGYYNTANGIQSLYSNTTGGRNTANGSLALYYNSTGNYNGANGYGALIANTIGNRNTADGFSSLSANTVGNNNVANGAYALFSNKTGDDNTAMGDQSLYSNTNGYYNTANGSNALRSTQTGSNNTALGYFAGQNLIYGNNNIALGYNTNFPSSTGSNQLNIGNWIYGNNGNIGIGASSPLTAAKLEINGNIKVNDGSASTGEVLTSIDANGLANWQPTGYPCIPTGTGTENYCYGLSALQANTSGNYNTANGWRSLKSNKTGSYNSAYGMQTLQSNTTGTYNSAFGQQALGGNGTGNFNIGIGYNAGSTLTSGDNNIFIGKSTQPNVGVTASNQMNIGNILYGNGLTGNGAGNIGIGMNNPTHKLDIAPGVAKIQSDGAGNPALFVAASSWWGTSIAMGILHGNGTNGLNWQTPGIWSGLSGFAIGHFNSGSTYDDACCDKASVDGKVDSNFDFTWNRKMRVGPAPWNAPAIASVFEVWGGDANINGLTVGKGAGNNNGSTAFGVSSLNSEVAGWGGNTAIGFVNLASTTQGMRNVAVGMSNLTSNTTGNDNTAIGNFDLFRNTTGIQNIALGQSALYMNLTGNDNIALGISSLGTNTGGINNVAIGSYALQNNVGSNNIAIGRAGSSLTSGNGNIFIGNGITPNISNTGSNQLNIGNWIYGNGGNIGIGVSTPLTSAKLEVAGQIKITGGGPGTGEVLTTDVNGLATWQPTGYPCTPTGAGTFNYCYGALSLQSNNTGSYNIANGYQALQNNTSGGYNVALGMMVLQNNTSGSYNTAEGVAAMQLNTTGSGNTANGNGALSTNTIGSDNTAEGAQALLGNTTGNSNVGLGKYAGSNLVSGSNNIAIGANINFASTSASNQLNIGNWIYGNGGNIGIGVTNPSTKLDINGGLRALSNIIVGSSGGEGGQIVLGYTGINPIGQANSTWNIDVDATNNFRVFSQNASGSTIIPFFINQVNGNIGISTSSPQATLDINGDALVNGVRVGQGGGNVATNTALGYSTLQNNTSGTNNVGVGYASLSGNTSGNSNTAVGLNSLFKNNTGFMNVAEGIYSLENNTSGYGNVANGAAALRFNTTGYQNIANGQSALIGNTIGSSNVANGASALLNNTIGSSNVAEGGSALSSNTSGSFNVAIGNAAGTNLTSGSGNIAIGTNTTFPSATASNQLNIGNLIYGTGLSGSFAGNIGIGTSTPSAKLEINGQIKITGGGPVNGEVLTTDTTGLATWQPTGYPCISSGVSNVCYGSGALPGGGQRNTAIGESALSQNNSGFNNTANGYWSLFSNTAGGYNTADGVGSLYSNLSGYDNVANGVSALFSNISGSSNTANGKQALYNSATGSLNTADGYYAGLNLTSGNNNIALGANTNFPSSTGSNQLNIGNLLYGIGLSGSNNGNIGIGTSNPTYKLEVNGDINAIGTVRANGVALTSDARFKQNIISLGSAISIIDLLRPVSYDWNSLGEKYGGEGDVLQYGFIAQEVEKIIPTVVHTDKNGYKSIDYIKIIPWITKGLQELAEQVNAQQKQIEDLKKENASLKSRLDAIEAKLR